MKIRTDFVTNSSSESYGVVVIDNPVLLDILARYKALETFGDDVCFEIGNTFPGYMNYSVFKREPDQDIKTITPAFYSFSVDEINQPSSLDEVLKSIIDVMDDDRNSFDDDLYQQLLKELKQRKDEITKAYITVKWFSHKVLYSERYGRYEFKFDQENGEDYYSEETGNLDW